MAVALVIFARWNPLYCLYAALLFGGAGALRPALQSINITWGRYLFMAAPYVLTLVIMVLTSSSSRTLSGISCGTDGEPVAPVDFADTMDTAIHSLKSTSPPPSRIRGPGTAVCDPTTLP